MSANAVEPLWDIGDVSRFLRVPVQTLYAWRKQHVGPPAARVGKYLRYDPAEVRAWLAKQTAA